MSTLRLGRRAVRQQKLGVGGTIALTFVVLLAVSVAFPGWIAPGNPLAIEPGDAFSPPTWAHWFGTDESGRDIYTRVVHGARSSVGIGVAATLIGAGLGTILGFTAGLGRKWVDSALGRLFEVLFALPTMVMALLLIAIVGPSSGAAVLAIGVATIPGYGRIVRARVRSVANSPYVEWSILDGVSKPRVFWRHILPNTLWPLVAMLTLGVGQAIVWVAALGFLGLGPPPPSPEWGAMLNAGRVYVTSAWWMAVMPAVVIAASAGALTLLGRKLGRTQ